MECPKCGSPAVVRLPPNQISPRPGYRCRDCGAKLRSPGTYVVYLVVLLIGLSVVVGIGYAMVGFGGADRPFQILWLAGISLVGAGYAAVQLSRPTPLSRPAADEAERSGDPHTGQ